MRVQSLSQKDPLEKKMATHSSILAWKILWTEEPGRATVCGVAKSQTQLRMHARAPVPRLQILLRRGKRPANSSPQHDGSHLTHTVITYEFLCSWSSLSAGLKNILVFQAFL